MSSGGCASVGLSYFESVALQASNYFTLREVEVRQSYPKEKATPGKNLVWLTKAT